MTTVTTAKIPATTAAAQEHELTVSIVLEGTAWASRYGSMANGAECEPYENWPVTVTNENGAVLGSGEVDGGTINDNAGGCVVALHVGTVPLEAQFGVSINGGAAVYFTGTETANDD